MNLKKFEILMILLLGFFIGTHGGFDSVDAIAADNKIIFKVATRFPPPPGDISRFGMTWLEKVKEKSGGRIEFKYFWGGSMTTAPEELSMLKNRAFDIGSISWLVQPGITPLGTVDWAVPFNTVDPFISLKAKKQLYKDIPEILEEITKQNMLPMLWYPMQPYWLYTKFPVKILADLKGKKIGCSGRDLTRFLKASGAITISNLVGDKYEMLQRRVTDGDLMSFDFMTDYKIYEVVKFLYKTKISRPVTAVYCINRDAWNELPNDIQKIMIEEAPAIEDWRCSIEPKLVDENMKKWVNAGVEISSIPQKEEALWAEQLKDYPQSWADEMEAKGLPGKKVMSRYIKALKENGEKLLADYNIK